MNSLVRNGLLTRAESRILDKARSHSPVEYYVVPLSWVSKLLNNSQEVGNLHIDSSRIVGITQSLDNMEKSNTKLLQHSWITLPLVYTQMVSLAAVSITSMAVFGEQFFDPPPNAKGQEMFPDTNIGYASKEPYSNHTPNIYIPIHTIIMLICTIGWVRVASCLLNPFGQG